MSRFGHRHAPCWSGYCSAEAARVTEHWTGWCQACPGVSCPAAGVAPALQLVHSGHAPGRVGSRLVPALLAHRCWYAPWSQVPRSVLVGARGGSACGPLSALLSTPG
eukprot:5771652-Lingulodinium_polyedra.AAC.1